MLNVPCAQPEAGGVNTYVPTGEDTLYMVFAVSAAPLAGREEARAGAVCFLLNSAECALLALLCPDTAPETSSGVA